LANTVLYIDDLPQLPAQTDKVLTQAGYELIHTADPEEALRIVREGQPALVLTEVLFSTFDGLDLIEQIAKQAAHPLPVVVVTRGERTPRLYGQAIELGVKDFLCKPVLRPQILEAVLAFASPEGEGARTQDRCRRGCVAGDLADRLLPEVMTWLHRSGASGVLKLVRESETRAVQFRNGSPVEVARFPEKEPTADYLLRTGRIDAEQHQMLGDQLSTLIGGPRKILLRMALLSEAQLLSATHEQGRDVLLEMFHWLTGRYKFYEGRRLEVADSLELACDPIEIVLAGVRHSPDEAIHDALSRHCDLLVAASTNAAGCLDKAGLSPEQLSNAESLTGEHSIVQVLDGTALDERALYTLFVMGAVEFVEPSKFTKPTEQPVLQPDQEQKPDEFEDSDPALPQDFLQQAWPLVKPAERAHPKPATTESPTEAQVRDANQAPRAGASRADAGRASPGSRGETPSRERILIALNEMAERIASQDDFTLFAVDNATCDAEVQTAYNEMRESVRLEDIPQEFDELRVLAKKLRQRLKMAFERVGSKEMRNVYAAMHTTSRAAPTPKEEQVDSRAVEAESWFRKGEGFLGEEQFGQAVEAFGMSVHLDPGQADYVVQLGYALHRSNPGNSVIRREALEHVAEGVKLAPNSEKPLLFLGRIFRELGDEAMAKKTLLRAAKIKPDCAAIAQELCLIDPERVKKKRGFRFRLGG
jgi:CheY-like chemotaxis protein